MHEYTEAVREARKTIKKISNSISIACELFVTKYSDMGAYFIEANHVYSLCDSRIKLDEIKVLISQATDDNESKSLGRLFESYKDRPGELNYGKIISEYHANKENYRYGKGVLQRLYELLEEDFDLTVNLIQPSPHIKVQQLPEIARKLWPTKS